MARHYGAIDNQEASQREVEPSEQDRKLLEPIAEALRLDLSEHAKVRSVIARAVAVLEAEEAPTVEGIDGRAPAVKSLTKALRVVDNKQTTGNRIYCGKMLRGFTDVRTRARSNSSSDKEAAEIIDKFLGYIHSSLSLQEALAKWVSWIPLASRGVMHAFWDRTAGDEIKQCPVCGYSEKIDLMEVAEEEGNIELDVNTGEGEFCPRCLELASAQATRDEMGNIVDGAPLESVPRLEHTTEGEVAFAVVDPNFFIPDAYATEPKNMQHATVLELLPLAEIEKRYPDVGAKVRDGQGLEHDPDTQLYKIDASSGALGGHALVATYYEVPSPKYKSGRIIEFCGSLVLRKRPNIISRLMRGRLPFFFATGDVRDGQFWSLQPILIQVAETQRRYNALLSDVNLHEQLTVRPPLLVPPGCGINADDFARLPGKVIPVSNISQKPYELLPQRLPEYIMSERRELVQSMFEKWTATEHERGVSKTNDSGRLAAVMDSQAQQLLMVERIKTNAEYQALCTCLVTLAMRYYAPDRVWAVHGKDRPSVVTASWSKAKITPGWSIYTVNEEAFSRNPVVKLEQAKQLKRDAPERYIDRLTGGFDDKKFSLEAGLDISDMAVGGAVAEEAYASHLPEEIMRAVEEGRPMPIPRVFDDVWIHLDAIKTWMQQHGRDIPPEKLNPVEAYYINLVKQVQMNGMQVPPAYVQAMPQVMPSAPNQGGPPQTSSDPQTRDAGQEANTVINEADRNAEGMVGPATHEH